MKQSKKIQYFLLIVIIFVGMCTGKIANAEPFSLATSKVSLEVKRKIEPVPESRPGGGSPTISSYSKLEKKKLDKLLKTGLSQNDWSVLGIVLIILVIVFKYLEKLKKEERG